MKNINTKTFTKNLDTTYFSGKATFFFVKISSFTLIKASITQN